MAPWRISSTLNDLPNWADGIHNLRTGRIGHETGERLDDVRAIRVSGERKHVGLLWLKFGHRRLQNLYQTLLERGHAGGRLGAGD